MKQLYFLWFLVQAASISMGQSRTPDNDSAVTTIHASYDKVSKIHRWFLGENYRKEWAQPVILPMIHLSTIHGGLTPVRQGGGMQSKSLRLTDKNGVEWVLRSVEKSPDNLLPENFKGTFAVDWVADEFSGQHPYSALIVPPLAAAANVPHANPIIGLIAPDSALAQYSSIFAGTICLLEEREPIGPSDNTLKMESALTESHDNRFDKDAFLRARLLDLLMGDWDRHEDQWRWAPVKSGKNKMYTAVPRDRDQVFHVNQGIFPTIAARSWIDPMLDNFNGRIPRIRYSLYKTRYIKCFPDAQFNYEDWMKIVNDFVQAETDSVLEAGLQRLPPENYRLRHDQLLRQLKQRRDNIPAAMTKYYQFVNRIADIRATDKNERITITDAPGKAMRVLIEKADKDGGTKGTLMDITYMPGITKELRLYTGAGNDHVTVNNASSPIKIRFVDSTGQKTYDLQQTSSKIRRYGFADSISVTGNRKRLRNHSKTDTAAGRFIATNPYNIWMPLATGIASKDDGFMLGLGFKYTGYDGFRKLPYSTSQQLMVTHSFTTNAFRIAYSGEWMEAIGKADIVLNADIAAPQNTINFFGLGNETALNKFEGYRQYYRSRFNTYEFTPALRWRFNRERTLSVGPTFQYYHLDPDDNTGRFISDRGKIGSYDSASIDKNKSHLGVSINYVSNTRDNNILPSGGHYAEIAVRGFTGLNSASKSYGQIKAAFTWYQKLDAKARLVLSDRIGGGTGVGNAAFYQSMFLGGQGNLLGFLQNRFAGQHMVFNNLQARYKIADVASYILPGQLGITAFYDAGRVWADDEHSDKWHQGVGGGIYFSPASLTVFQILAAHSTEGWYPYISFNFRL